MYELLFNIQSKETQQHFCFTTSVRISWGSNAERLRAEQFEPRGYTNFVLIECLTIYDANFAFWRQLSAGGGQIKQSIVSLNENRISQMKQKTL